MKKLIRWAVFILFEWVGFFGIDERLRTDGVFVVMGQILDHWAMRLFLIVVGGLVVTYPQWRGRASPKFPDGSPMGRGYELRWWFENLKDKFRKPPPND